jgi:hypothetical protein
MREVERERFKKNSGSNFSRRELGMRVVLMEVSIFLLLRFVS